MRKNFNSSMLLVCCSVFLFLLSGCAQEPQEPEEIINSTIIIGQEYPTYQTAEDMVDVADYIVKGRYTESIGSYNVTRDPNDPTKESSTVYSEGKKFNFEISDVLYGDISASEITISKKVSNGYWTETKDKQPMQIQIPDAYYVEPELDVETVLFLKYSQDIDLYYSIGEPWELLIDNDGKLTSSLEVDESNNTLVKTQIEDTLYQTNIQFMGKWRGANFLKNYSLDQLKETILETK